jgi:hypothetical protein
MECLIKDRSQLVNSNGRFLTQGLFYEYRYQSAKTGPYNLKEQDWKGTLSMYQIYMACDSEYDAAQRLLGSWKHWEALLESPFFIAEVSKWREEREIKEAALAKTVLLEQAEEGSVSAAKSLLDQITKRKAGRPTKAEVTAERQKQAAIDSNVTSLLSHVKV